MDRSLAIGGVLYEIISPSVRNVSLAQEYLKELPEEISRKYFHNWTKKDSAKSFLAL